MDKETMLQLINIPIAAINLIESFGELKDQEIIILRDHLRKTYTRVKKTKSIKKLQDEISINAFFFEKVKTWKPKTDI